MLTNSEAPLSLILRDWKLCAAQLLGLCPFVGFLPANYNFRFYLTTQEMSCQGKNNSRA